MGDTFDDLAGWIIQIDREFLGARQDFGTDFRSNGQRVLETDGALNGQRVFVLGLVRALGADPPRIGEGDRSGTDWGGVSDNGYALCCTVSPGSEEGNAVG